MEITPRKQLISEKILSLYELKSHPKSIEIYGKNENIDDLVQWMNESGYDIRFPIFINENYEIISGHRRVRAAIKVGLKEIPVQIYKYSNKWDELEDLLITNINRIKENLSIIRENKLREEILHERGIENQKLSPGRPENIQNKGLVIITKPLLQKIEAQKQIAIDMGIGEQKYYRGKEVLNVVETLEKSGETKSAQIFTDLANKFTSHNIAYDVKKQIEKSGIDISVVLKQPSIEKIISQEKTSAKDIKKAIEIETIKIQKEQLSKDINVHFKDSKLSGEELKEIQDNINRGIFKTKEQIIESINTKNIKTIPEKFDVVVIDPPWPYGTEYDEETRRVGSPYPEMSLEEIININIPAKDDCVLWLWTTHKFMRESFKILDKWGFQDKMIVTWVKNRMGMGSWLRSKSEFCIMAIKGNPVITLTNQTTVLNADVREHSRKPDEFYKMVESLCTGIKLDYFSREKRDGWYQYGNETNKF